MLWREAALARLGIELLRSGSKGSPWWLGHTASTEQQQPGWTSSPVSGAPANYFIAVIWVGLWYSCWFLRPNSDGNTRQGCGRYKETARRQVVELQIFSARLHKAGAGRAPPLSSAAALVAEWVGEMVFTRTDLELFQGGCTTPAATRL